MIVSDTFVFIHLHKSGGTFINQMMLKCLPGAERLGYHLPYRELPTAYRHLPVIGTVRNPWDYYVSWYFFQASQARPNALFQICSEHGTLDFSETVTHLARLHQDERRIDRLRSALPETFVGYGLNLTKSCLDTLPGSGLGFYSFLYQRMYAGAERLHIVPIETLREGLRSEFAHLGIDLPPLARYFIDLAPPMNTSIHGDYRTYFSRRLWETVEEAEAMVIGSHYN